MPKLSVVIITLDEASNIDDALASVAWADEIVVVDCGSTDDTVALAQRHTNRVSQRDWTGYGDQKNHGNELATHDWVLSLDADERVSPRAGHRDYDPARTGPGPSGVSDPPHHPISGPVDPDNRLVPGSTTAAV